MGTPIAKTWPTAVTRCNIETKIDNVESSCPGYNKLIKYFSAATSAGECLITRLGIAGIDGEKVNWISEHLPIEILEAFDFDEVDTCAKDALTAKMEEIKEKYI